MRIANLGAGNVVGGLAAASIQATRSSSRRRSSRAPRAELSDYQRRGDLRHHPSDQPITKQTPQDQFEVLR